MAGAAAAAAAMSTNCCCSILTRFRDHRTPAKLHHNLTNHVAPVMVGAGAQQHRTEEEVGKQSIQMKVRRLLFCSQWS